MEYDLRATESAAHKKKAPCAWWHKGLARVGAVGGRTAPVSIHMDKSPLGWLNMGAILSQAKHGAAVRLDHIKASAGPVGNGI